MTTIDAAIRDSEDLVKWAEPNTIALEDEKIDAMFPNVLAGPVPDACEFVPLLRFANRDLPDVPLLDALLDDKTHTVCDRCRGRVPRTDRLLVPSGGAVVAIYCCFFCRDVLDDIFACGLVWG